MTSRKALPVPTGRTLAVLLAALSMLGPFSVDTYLPAFPDIEASLGAAPIEVQQTLTAYMFAFGFMTLWHGALSDAFGRRNIVIGALAVFAVASLGCAAAHRVEYLWAFRVLQGVSAGAGIVIGRAIIRDLYSGAAAARLLSLVTMIFAIAPAIAPILGGWIVKLSDWRTIFLFLFGFSVLLVWQSVRRLPETLPQARRTAFSPRSLALSYWNVFTSLVFQLKAGALAFNFAGLFLFVAAAPIFVTRHLGLGPEQFAWQFVPMVAGIFFGALASNRLAGRITVARHVGIGFAFLVGGAAFNVLYHLAFPPALPWSVLPLMFYAFGMSVAAPMITLLVMDLYPGMRGLVASCQSFTQTMLGALVAGVIAPLLSHAPVWLAAGQLACATLGLLLWLGGYSYHAAQTRRAANAWEAVQVE
jgi:DHA1 family bicyclomycin/chloramphenicol resistance-like MFS transporter